MPQKNSADSAPFVEALLPLCRRLRHTAYHKQSGAKRNTFPEPMTPELLAEHVTGPERYGLYFIEHGSEVTQAACIDIDDHERRFPLTTLLAAAKRIIKHLPDTLKAHPWLSSSGHGVHLWFVWDTAQDAYSVRRALQSAMRDAGFSGGLTNYTLPVKGADNPLKAEVFPKQNRVGFGSYGNFAWLPLAKASVPVVRDEGTLRPGTREDAVGYTWVPSASVPLLVEERLTAQELELKPPFCEVTSLPETLEKIRDYTNFIDPSSREAWVQVGLITHFETGGTQDGFAVWDEWSQGAEDKYDPEDQERTWNSFNPEGKENVLRLGSMKVMAAEGGWTEPLSDEELEELAGTEPARPKPALLTLAEAAGIPAPSYLIKEVLYEKSMSMIYGASTAGKTFFALDLAMSLASAQARWQELRLTKDPGAIVYIAAEDCHGVTLRARAWCKHRGVDPAALGEDFLILPTAPDMHEGDTTLLLEKLVSRGANTKLVIIDTMARVLPGANENTAEDMGRFLKQLERIQTEMDCAVLVVHHSGKDETKGERGWSGLKAAMDTQIRVGRVEDAITIRRATIVKQKNGPEGAEWFFEIKGEELGTDEDGDPVVGGVAQYLDKATVSAQLEMQKAMSQETGKQNKEAAWANTFLDAAQCVLVEDYGPRDDYRGLQVSEKKVKAAATAAGLKGKAYTGAREALMCAAVVSIEDGVLRLN